MRGVLAAGCSLVFAIAANAAGAAEVAVPIVVHASPQTPRGAWPVTAGVPFARGAVSLSRDFFVTGPEGREVPAQITRLADWDDLSPRWVLVDFRGEGGKTYTLRDRTTPSTGRSPGVWPGNIDVTERDGGVVVDVGTHRYVFRAGGGCFDEIAIEGKKIVSSAARAFYAIDSTGARSELIGGKPKIELAGRRHAIVRTEGEYRTAAGEVVARAVVDFHFYAELDAVRVSHQFVVTRDTNAIWFRDLGMELALAAPAAKAPAAATFNVRRGAPFEARVEKIDGARSLVMVQDDFPHFGSTSSRFRVIDSATPAKPLATGEAAGDWADLSTGTGGIAVQLPGFAEQFPKAFRVAPNKIGVAFWAKESGRELDFRTPQLVAQYFGHDWIPADHECATIANNAEGTAKTHDFWIHPHARPLAAEDRARFAFAGAGSELYASVDPAQIARTEAMGILHPADPQQFPEEEALIAEYFDRTVRAGDRIFPATGYLYWGMYPYSAQPWRIANGRWYPTIHRLARGLEYGLKRGVWVLYARSGERKYRDYARRYTRLLRDLSFSHTDAPLKPKGWIVQGPFHCPIIWGQFGDEAIAKGRAGKRPNMVGEVSGLTYASSEDVVQFAYDYFLTGDLHSRDMLRTYVQALIEGTGLDAKKTIAAGGTRPEAMLRMIGSAYELEHDPRLAQLGSQYLRVLLREDGTPAPEHPVQWGKFGEVFHAYYYYWISTRDPLARRALVRLAELEYRRGALGAFDDRASPLLEAFAIAAEDTKDPRYLAYASRGLQEVIDESRTRSLPLPPLESLSPATTEPWGQVAMTGQATINLGIPAAEAVLAGRRASVTKVPFAIKPAPTAKTRIVLEKGAGAAQVELFVNNVGDRAHRPRLVDRAGREAAIRAKDRADHRVDRADQAKGGGLSEWYMRYEDQIFYRLEIPASVPPGKYFLELGDEVAFTVLWTDLQRISQIAPDGLVIPENERVYFSVPAGAGAVEYFASSPVDVAGPDGRAIAVEELGEGRRRFAANPAGGAYSLVRRERIPAFVRMVNIPFVTAIGDPSRLVTTDPGLTQRAQAATPDEGPTEGRFGKGAYLHRSFFEVPPSPESPRERGTVELWIRPMWSATEMEHGRALTRVQMYRGDPVTLAYYVDPDPDRSGDYNRAFILLQIAGIGSVRAQAFFEEGKWYHVAATWNVDGNDNDATIFVNGRKRTDATPLRKLKPRAPVAKLVHPPKVIAFGSGHMKSGAKRGEIYDELRVSNIVRYTKDFDPAAAPFRKDEHTVLLVHFDGDEPRPELRKGKMP